MKDEIAELIAGCDTYNHVAAIVDDWMDYYNNDRYQWDLEKLSPREYYQYRLTGVYPLKTGVSKNRSPRGSAPDPEVSRMGFREGSADLIRIRSGFSDKKDSA